jgi:murein endopeptidase
MIYGLMNAGASWMAQHDWPRIGVGEISLKNGGPISGHTSHQVGKDADLRPVRVSGEGPTAVGESSYSKARSLDLITHHLKLSLNVQLIFFNDAQIDSQLSYVQSWPNHYNHMHVRIW